MNTITYDPSVYKLVPIEPDDDMITAACDASNLFRFDAMRSLKAAIASAPCTLHGVVVQQAGQVENEGMHASAFVKVWGDAGGGDAGRIALANYAYCLGSKSAQPDGEISHNTEALRAWITELEGGLRAAEKQLGDEIQHLREQLAAQASKTQISQSPEASWPSHATGALSWFISMAEEAGVDKKEIMHCRSLIRPLLLAQAGQEQIYPACNGKNCRATDGKSHSVECFAEHQTCVSGELNLLDNPYNRNPEYRYTGAPSSAGGEMSDTNKMHTITAVKRDAARWRYCIENAEFDIINTTPQQGIAELVFPRDSRIDEKWLERHIDAAIAQPERVALSDAAIKRIVINIANEMYGKDDEQYTEADAMFYGAFVRAILSAQADLIPDSWELDPHPPSRHCMCEECKPSFETDCLGNCTEVSNGSQPLIAEAARDDVVLSDTQLKTAENALMEYWAGNATFKDAFSAALKAVHVVL